MSNPKVVNVHEGHLKLQGNIFYVALEVRYYENSCPGNVTCYEIYDIILSTDIENWVNQCPAVVAGSSCVTGGYYPMSNWTTPNNTLSGFLMSQVNALLPGSPSKCYTFHSGCYSIIELNWPPGSIYTVTGDNGSTDYPLTYSKVIVPCDGGCCVLLYNPNSDPTTILSGNGECGLRDATWQLPYSSNGNQASIQSESGCKSYCDPYTQFTTNRDVNAVKHSMIITANPTVVSDLMRFTVKDAIINSVDIYDNVGRRVKKVNVINNEIHLAELAAGIYFVQVNLSGGKIQTVRIQKQ